MIEFDIDWGNVLRGSKEKIDKFMNSLSLFAFGMVWAVVAVVITFTSLYLTIIYPDRELMKNQLTPEEVTRLDSEIAQMRSDRGYVKPKPKTRPSKPQPTLSEAQIYIMEQENEVNREIRRKKGLKVKDSSSPVDLLENMTADQIRYYRMGRLEMIKDAVKLGYGEWVVIDDVGTTEFKWKKK